MVASVFSNKQEPRLSPGMSREERIQLNSDVRGSGDGKV